MTKNTKFYWNRFSKNSNFSNYIKITVVYFLFQTLMLLVHGFFQQGENFISEVLFLSKMILYFLIFPCFASLYFTKIFVERLPVFLFIFFGVSSTILAYNLTKNPLESLLWKSNEFGSRFVGFTGSSINFDGLVLIGSTANSVGILYCLIFAYLLKTNPKKIHLLSLCLFGCLITLSQSALAVLTMLMIMHFLTNANRKSSLKLCLSLTFVIAILVSQTNIMFRITDSIDNLLAGNMPSSVHDRILHWKSALQYIENCPMGLFTGLIQNLNCGKVTIYESYFLDVFSKTGMMGLLLAVLHFYFLIKLWNSFTSIKLTVFWIPWVFSLIFFNDTFRTDFILYFIFSIILFEGAKLNEKRM